MKDDWNTPRLAKLPYKTGFQEVWYLKFNDPVARRALWLRFTLLQRDDLSREIAEVWAIFFHVDAQGTHKVAVKNTFPLARFIPTGDDSFSIGPSRLHEGETEGALSDQHNSIRWHVSGTQRTRTRHDFVPACLSNMGLVKNLALTVQEDLIYSGWCEVNGKRYNWEDAPGMQGHLAGPRNGHSWAWGHCNAFLHSTGAPAPVIWDGLCARARLGSRAAPAISSMFFHVNGVSHHLNTLWTALHIKSQYDFEGWTFRARSQGILFEGKLVARAGDYAGVTYEDTDGSFLYCHNTKIADMTMLIRHPDGADQQYFAKGCVAYEVVSRAACPQVPFLI